MTALRRAWDHLASHKRWDLVLIAAITLLAARGWFNPGVPNGHDTLADALMAYSSAHTVSLQGLLSGWSGNWYLGTPLFYVHAPLVSFLIRALSCAMGWTAGLKLVYLCFWVLSGTFAYLYVYELTRSRVAGFAAGLAYVFLPYHVLEVAFEGHHGAFGLPYMLAPLLFLALERLLRKPGPGYILLNALLLAALVLTYPQVFPILVGPFYVLYAMVGALRERRRGGGYLKTVSAATAGAVGLSLLLTAFWWLPLIDDLRYFAATAFPLEDARGFSATFCQAITLRPAFCCAPGSAFGASGSALTETLRAAPFVMVLGAMLLDRRRWHVWFFCGSLAVAVLLSMGPDSPVKLFSLAYRLVPFFDGLRTPWRFLLFGSLSYAVLIGFFVGAAVRRLRGLSLRPPRAGAAAACFLVLAVLLLLANTWRETREALSTFTLTPEQQSACQWLEEQEDGDYRITDLPLSTWSLTAEGRWVINPICWTWLHDKACVYGGVPATALACTADILDFLSSSRDQGASLDEWLRLFGVRYVVRHRAGADAGPIGPGRGYSLAWSGESLDIYESPACMPRAFAVSYSDRRELPPDGVRLAGAGLGLAVTLSLDEARTRSAAPSLAARFRCTGAGEQWASLGVDVSHMAMDGDDCICLGFYSEQAIAGACITIDALEADGSRYGMDLRIADGIAAGWNDVEIPLRLLLRRDPADGGPAIDPGRTTEVRFGIRERAGGDMPGDFTLWFDRVAVMSAAIDTGLEYRHTGSGRYSVHVDQPSPFRLVLSESYHPGWTATAGGACVPASACFECINGFDLPAGEYDVVLEYTPSPLRAAGCILSGASLLLLLASAALLLALRARRMRSKDRGPVLKWHHFMKEGQDD